MGKKSKASRFQDLEAEEGSDSEDGGGPDAKRRHVDREEKESKEVRDLRLEMERRAAGGEFGARRVYGDFLSKWEETAVESHKEDLRREREEREDDDVFLDPEVAMAKKQQKVGVFFC